MLYVLLQTYTSLAFLIANVLILVVILVLNRRTGDRPGQQETPAKSSDQKIPDPYNILGWEFEYARTTASEAMQDRHTMVNFYLLAVGVVASGVVAVLGQDAGLPKATGTLLLWPLCGVGWLYFLKLIRLRQAKPQEPCSYGRFVVSAGSIS
jgi:hypothetical protein